MKRAPVRLFRILRDELEEYVRWFATNRMSRQARAALGTRTGTLAGSFKYATEGADMGTLRALVYTDARYAPLQEFGGTIRPKARKALTIPLQAALTQGSPLEGVPGAGATRGRAPSFGFTDTFVGRDAGGDPFIFRRVGEDKVEPLFRLVPEVTVPARLGFFRTWEQDSQERESMLAAAVDKALDGLGEA